MDFAKTGNLIEEIVAAHGGRYLWDSLEGLEAELSADGFLFRAKHLPRLSHARVWASARRPHFVFHDYPKPGQTGEFIGDEEVSIRTGGGEVLQRRPAPRSEFLRFQKKMWWDSLDFIYFGGYATWNYLTTPFLFLRDGFGFEYLGQRNTEPGVLSCIRVTFPDDLPTHCRVQTFFFDADKLLRRLDYTAEVVGNWAHVAHFCEDYRNFSGLKIPTHRTVRPLLGSHIFSMPTIVELHIHNVSPLRSMSVTGEPGKSG